MNIATEVLNREDARSAKSLESLIRVLCAPRGGRDRYDQTKTASLRAGGKAPPSRLELLSSAPEADTLSTELRGQAAEFYHGEHRVHRGALRPLSVPRGLELFYDRPKLGKFPAQRFDDGGIASLIAKPAQLFLLMCEFTADLIEPPRVSPAKRHS